MRRKVLYTLILLVISLISIFMMTACNSKNYETNTYEVNEDFSNITIKTNSANVVFSPSNDGVCEVSCYEEKKNRHTVEVRDGVLFVEVVNEKKWHDYVGFNIENPKITIYLPDVQYSSLIIKGETGDVEIPKNFAFNKVDLSLSTGKVKCFASVTEQIKIVASTGDVYIEDLSVCSLDVSVSTGKVTVSGVTCDGDVSVNVSTGKVNFSNTTCKNFASIGSTGDVLLKRVVIKEKISIKRSTGDVKFENSDGGEIFVKTDTGDVKGSLLTKKLFNARSDTGRVWVPISYEGGKCEIITDTGNIDITVLEN